MRKKRAPKREVMPDVRYNNVLISKLINAIMERGKKSLAESIVYKAVDLVSEKTEKDGYEVLLQALDNILPSVEVKRKRVRGATFQVPQEPRPERKRYLAIDWLKKGAQKRSNKTMAARLADEIIAAANKENSNALKKRSDMQKMADANKAFASLR